MRRLLGNYGCSFVLTISLVGLACSCGGGETGSVDAADVRDATGTADADVGAADASLIDASPADAGLLDAATSDAGAAVSPGSYSYEMLPINAQEVVRVEFHPDGRYAVVLSRLNLVYIYDWPTRTTQTVNLDIPGPTNDTGLYDLAFDPSGDFFYVVGAETVAGAETGVIFRFNDALVRAGMATAAATRLSETRAGERFSAIEYPIAPHTGGPVVLSTTQLAAYTAYLRELNTTTDTFSGFSQSWAADAALMDMAWSNNAFGGWGIALVGGFGGTDAPYYTEIASSPTWTPEPTPSLGAVHRIAAHPSGNYALGIGTTGDGSIHRIEGGAWFNGSTSPSWAFPLFGVAFQQAGQRALIVGRTRGDPLVGTVLEYRHDLWSTPAVTDVSIPNFSAPPLSGNANYKLHDAAFRPGCDGGLIAAGETNTNRGLIIEFGIDGQTSCGGVLSLP